MFTNKKLVALGIVVLLVVAVSVTFTVFRTGNYPQPIMAEPPSVEREVTLLALQHVDSWPGLLQTEKTEIQTKLDAKDDAGALERIKKAVYDGVSRQMVKLGYKVSERRWGWDNNNHSTTLLFIDLPLAKRLGKEREMIREWREHGNWFPVMENISKEKRQQYADWHTYGHWPFEGEDAPIYKRS
jgi:hypothetical protein